MMDLAEIIIESFILLFALLAGIVSLRLYDLIKGGQLGASWRWLIGSAVFFAIMQIIEITNRAGYISFTNIEFAILLLKALTALFLMLGFWSYKKSLF